MSLINCINHPSERKKNFLFSENSYFLFVHLIFKVYVQNLTFQAKRGHDDDDDDDNNDNDDDEEEDDGYEKGDDKERSEWEVGERITSSDKYFDIYDDQCN